MNSRSLSLSRNATWLSAVVLLIGTLSLFGCNPQPAETKTVPFTDSDLDTAVRAKLNTVEALRAADLDIDADADTNRIALSGKVSSEALRTEALELARSAHPGVVVEAKIDVVPPDVARSDWTEEYSRAQADRAKSSGDEVGSSLDDTWIHSKIVTKLIVDPGTPERRINVDVRDKVVTLRGTVASNDQKNEAARIAKETEGVRRVQNDLRVSVN